MKNIIMSLMATLGLTASCAAQDNIKTVDTQAFAEMVKADSNAVVLDVRTEKEYAEGHLADAVNLDYLNEETFAQEIAKLDKTKHYYVYCRSGRRSHNAAVKMQGLGLQVVDMEGGWLAWTEAGMPTATNADKQAVAKETFATKSGKTLIIGLIKHGSLSMSYEGYEIQVDPVAAYGKPTDYAAMPKADLILVTHEHADHLDAQAIETLTKEQTVLYLNQRSHNKIQRGEVLHNGDNRTVGKGILISAVPAYNTTPAHLQFHPKGVGNGYVLEIGGLRVYVAGDTEDIDEMEQLTDIDVAFLPVNQPYTMTVEQAVRAARVIHPRVLLPYHFGETDVEKIKQQLADTDIDVRLRDMQ